MTTTDLKLVGLSAMPAGTLVTDYTLALAPKPGHGTNG